MALSLSSLAVSLRRTVLAAAIAVVAVSPAFAQFGGGGGGLGGGGLGGGGLGGGGGGNTAGASGQSGVAVDADGTLRKIEAADADGSLARQRAQEAFARLDGDLQKPSKLRKVSLTRLEKAVAAKIAAGSGPDEAMQHLAGLTRVEYVFCYPETGDIVIAGPAEPWGQHPSGRTLGLESGRPVIELQDVITALRAFPPAAQGKSPLIYCSIDPTPEGLSRMQEFLRQFGRQATPNDTQIIVNKLQESLGPQVITIGGVPAETHFAQVLVEADYRMKLIGIGLEQPPVRLTSYVDRANPAQVSRNALQRWYFVPDYQCARVTEDGMAMQLVGTGVKLVGEDEVISANGGRQGTGTANRASSEFTRAFTQMYSKLADRSPVYAQLRNCIDLAVLAAFVQQRDLYSVAKWEPSTFADESAYPVATYNAPKSVATAVNSIWKNRTLMTPVGGGVQIQAGRALESENVLADEEGAVATQRQSVDLSKLGADQWWWD